MNIASKYSESISTQKYTEKAHIDGLQLVPLTLHTDDGGNFLEIFRMQDGTIQGLEMPFQALQVSMSMMEPSVVKAYHIHQNQDDLWFVPPTHRLLVNQLDIREDSPTFDTHIRLVLGGGSAKLLRIPHGVAHGVKNCYSQPMYLFYATNQQFNPEQPDELRLPWDHFGADVWDLQKG